MGRQGTRHRIRKHAGNAVKSIEDCMYHLQCVHNIADGRSTIIEAYMPGLITMLDGAKKVLDEFNDQL